MARRDPEYDDFMVWMQNAGYSASLASQERSYLRRITTEQEHDYSRAAVEVLQQHLAEVLIPDTELPSRHNHRKALRRYIAFVNDLRKLRDDVDGTRLAAARTLIRERHVQKAVRMIEGQGENGLAWLYRRTGRVEPKHRYVVVENVRYPTKAFGYLVAQLAGKTTSTANVMTTEEAYSPLRRLGYEEIRGFTPRTPAQMKAAEDSYYRQLARPQQPAFRRALLAAYGSTCALSQIAVAGALEAAHVIPFRLGEDTLANGVLLRADLHRLFDLGFLAFAPPDMTAHFAPVCLPDYRSLQGRTLARPAGGPSALAFKDRWTSFKSSWPASIRR